MENLNLSEEMKRFIAREGAERGLFKEYPELDPSEHLQQGEIPDGEVEEILSAMESQSEDDQKYEGVLREIGGWPVRRNRYKWYVPNLYVIGVDETIYWDFESIQEKTGYDRPVRVFALYLVDQNCRVHIGSMIGSTEAYRIGGWPVIYPLGGLEYLRGMGPDEKERFRQFEDEVVNTWDRSTELVEYYARDMVDNPNYVTCRHIGAPGHKVCDITETKETGLPDQYRNYMDDLAGEGLRDIHVDLDVFGAIQWWIEQEECPPDDWPDSEDQSETN